jgi:hypothetical protein
LALAEACAPLVGGKAMRRHRPFRKDRARPDAQRCSAPRRPRVRLGATDSGGDRSGRRSGDRFRAIKFGDTCALVARGAESVEDIDLLAYGDDGTVLGSDEAPNKKPALLVCPPHPRRLFVVARVAAGHGLVGVGALRVSAYNAI